VGDRVLGWPREDFRVVFPESSMTVATTAIRSRSGRVRNGGALLFRDIHVTGVGHAAVSMGDNRRTFEAMGSAYGVRFGQIHGRTWTSAGLISEMDYKAAKEAQPRVERAVVFGKKGGRLGFVAAEKLDTDEAGERLLTLLRRADSDTGAGILVIRKEPKDLELQDEWPQFKASKAR
jgi:hypothetical protein